MIALAWNKSLGSQRNSAAVNRARGGRSRQGQIWSYLSDGERDDIRGRGHKVRIATVLHGNGVGAIRKTRGVGVRDSACPAGYRRPGRANGRDVRTGLSRRLNLRAPDVDRGCVSGSGEHGG